MNKAKIDSNKASEKQSFSKQFFKAAIIKNPVLAEVLGLCPVVAAATSTMNALVLSADVMITLIICEVIASLALKRVARWLRVAVYVIIGIAVTYPAFKFVETGYSEMLADLGIYLPLVAANSLAALHCEKIAVRSSVKVSFFDAIGSSVGYCSVMIIVGFIRELIGAGSVFGHKLPFLPTVSGMLMPFGGLLIVAFLAALHRAFVLKKHPKYKKAIRFNFKLHESKDEDESFHSAVHNRFSKSEQDENEDFFDDD